MVQLILKEWRPGLKKVSATKLLQERAGLPLSSAKACVDRLLKNETVFIDMSDAQEAKKLAHELNGLGAICEVRNEESKF